MSSQSSSSSSSSVFIVAVFCLATAAAGPVAAQSSCGDSYTIRPGDTLSAVARQCGVALPEIMAANPGIEPRRLGVGQVVRLPGAPDAAPVNADTPPPEDAARESAEGSEPWRPSAAEWGMINPDDDASDPDAPPGANYVVRAGDSLPDIAKRFDTTVAGLVRDNPQLIRQKELRQGQRLLVPGAGDSTGPVVAGESAAEVGAATWTAPRYSLGAAAEVLPRRVAVGDPVTIYARGLPSRTRVEIAAGDPDGRMVVIDRDTTDHYGTVRARVRLPRDLDPQAPLTIVVSTADRAHGAKSRELQVGAIGTTTAARAGERIEVTGTLTTEGTLCPALRTPDGTLYTLSGDIADLQPGERVRVVGLVAGTSQCNQGITLSTARIERAVPERAER